MKTFKVSIEFSKEFDLASLDNVMKTIDRLAPDIEKPTVAIVAANPTPTQHPARSSYADHPHKGMLAVGMEEAAKILGVSKKTVERQIYRGELPAFKLGWQWRIRVAEIENFMKRLEEKTRRMTGKAT